VSADAPVARPGSVGSRRGGESARAEPMFLARFVFA
jgi:hypothetical protein